jgi:hypothetical protein
MGVVKVEEKELVVRLVHRNLSRNCTRCLKRNVRCMDEENLLGSQDLKEQSGEA